MPPHVPAEGFVTPCDDAGALHEFSVRCDADEIAVRADQREVALRRVTKQRVVFREAVLLGAIEQDELCLFDRVHRLEVEVFEELLVFAPL